MAYLKMPTAQTITLYEELNARDFMLEQKNHELEGKQLEICDLETVVEELTVRAALADDLEQQLKSLSMFTESVLRERQAEKDSSLQWPYAATEGFDGYSVPLPPNPLVVHPTLWYSSA
jgi:hypothetical protein